MMFSYNMVNDVLETKVFYGELLGMKIDHYVEGKYVGVNGGQVSLLFFKADQEVPIQREWAWQPGDATGSEAEVDSFSLEYSEDSFKAVFNRLKQTPKILKNPRPEWRQNSYWGITLKDPTGKTIELYTTPERKPNEPSPVWKD